MWSQKEKGKKQGRVGEQHKTCARSIKDCNYKTNGDRVNGSVRDGWGLRQTVASHDTMRRCCSPLSANAIASECFI